MNPDSLSVEVFPLTEEFDRHMDANGFKLNGFPAEELIAEYELVKTYQFDGFRVVQFELPELAHFAYLLISRDQALLIDPGRDIGVYLNALQAEQLHLFGVFLTHTHADFVAGHMEAAAYCDKKILVAHTAHAHYPHHPVFDQDMIRLGDVMVRLIATPGHTPDGMCACVYPPGGSEPAAVFTGDTLFAGSMGRPDLLNSRIPAEELANAAFDSWNTKLAPLPDATVVFPAHGAGSLCGAKLSPQKSTTIGEERENNPYLQAQTRESFIERMCSRLPEAPLYFQFAASANRLGPTLVDWEADPAIISPDIRFSDPGAYFVIDVRGVDAYLAGHIPNSINIGLHGKFATWTGSLVAPKANIILVGNSRFELAQAARRLHRIGYCARGLFFPDWEALHFPLAHTLELNAEMLFLKLNSPNMPVILDVRTPEEWRNGHIAQSLNLPLHHLPDQVFELEPGKEAITVCASGYRAAIAVGILERAGFNRIATLSGGMEAWEASRLPMVK